MPPTAGQAAPGSSPGIPEPRTTGHAEGVQRIGCVAYLNAKPLIQGLEGLADPVVSLDVPSALLGGLERGEVDIALCPVIDYFRSAEPLVVVPVGCIASDGATHTVRLFSRTPIASIDRVYADTDSHTSVALLRVVLNKVYGIDPTIVPFDARQAVTPGEDEPASMLLIGDKVVNHAPSAELYPHQLDLGAAWKEMTGLPFVFAVWMAKRDTDLGGLPDRLDRLRDVNAKQIGAIAKRHAEAHGWDVSRARDYLGRILSYRVGGPQLEAIRRFAEETAALKLIDQARPVALWRAGS